MLFSKHNKMSEDEEEERENDTHALLPFFFSQRLPRKQYHELMKPIVSSVQFSPVSV